MGKEMLGRREALEKMMGTLLAGLAVSPTPGKGETSETTLPPLQPREDVIVRMMRDLHRALRKPPQERRWVMVIDLRKCIGCHACTISCAVENKLPPGVFYRPVLEQEWGTFPHVARRFLPRPCMQCEKPPCLPVCPVTTNPHSPDGKATWKRPDGIVVVDYEMCIGCRRCVNACPYGARTIDEGNWHTEGTPASTEVLVGQGRAQAYEKAPAYEYGRPWERSSDEPPTLKARKCHFCLHRLERGLLPQCTVTCVGRATFFGDAYDSESLVAELIGKPNAIRLKEEAGTEPKVFYLL